MPAAAVPAATITFAASAGDATTAVELKLTSAAGATANVQAYKLGLTAAVAGTAQLAGAEGKDGTPPDAAALIGDENAKTGLFALADVDLFNILCIPRTAVVSGANALDGHPGGHRHLRGDAVLRAAPSVFRGGYAEQRR